MRRQIRLSITRAASVSLQIFVFALSFGPALAAPPSGKTATFLSTAEEARWCAFSNAAKAKAAAAGGKFDGGDAAWLKYHGATIDNLVIAIESEDSYVEDTYLFDRAFRVKQVTRRGHYINDPFFSVVFVPDRSGKLVLTGTSKIRVKAEERARHETYFLEWPLYSTLAKIPVHELIETHPVVRVVEACRPGRNGSR